MDRTQSSPARPVVEAVEPRQFLSATSAAGVSFVAYEDVSFHGVVAHVTGAPANLRLAAGIDWGDGTTSPGRVVKAAKGGFDVIGTHTYAEDGKYTLDVVVSGGPKLVPGQPNPFFFIKLAETGAKAEVRDLRPVAYHRSHWIPDLTLDIRVTSDGTLTVWAPTIRTRPVKLTEAQEDRLREAFEAWGTLKSNYPNPPGTADANDVTIAYGRKSVTVGDAADAPTAFRTVQHLLETLAGL
ncbi:MAG TPA: hypothetical protein VF796_03110 [Humisphaera sp.]